MDLAMDKKGIFGLVALSLGLILWLVYGPAIERKLGLAPAPVVAKAVPKDALPLSVAADKASLTTDAVTAKETPAASAVFPAARPLPPLTLQVPGEMDLQILPGRGLGTVTFPKHQLMKGKDQKVHIGDDLHPSLAWQGSAKEWKFGQTSIISQDARSISTRTDVLISGKECQITETWTLDQKHPHSFTRKVEIRNLSVNESLKISDLEMNCGLTPPIQFGDLDFFAKQAMGFDQGVDCFDAEDDKVHTEFLGSVESDLKDLEAAGKPARIDFDKPEHGKGLKWLAVKNQYFAFIVKPSQPWESCYLNHLKVERADRKIGDHDKHYTLVSAAGKFSDFDIAPGATKELIFDIFAGPQELQELKDLGDNRQGVMQLNMFMWFKVGWLGWMSQGILKILKFFYHYVQSWGLAIILLTIFVKLLFWRLTNKSNESMKKMSALGPKMKELQEKHKDNPQLQSQKVMELYKEEGVNPLGGCLPMLLQMPVFIALFNALRSAIELRHSDFLWATDLSMPDTVLVIPGIGLPIRPLAIAWCSLMLLQQKLMPSSADDMQRKMMMAMPVVMLVLCYGMPSGLTLYWPVPTLMTILHYKLSNTSAPVSTVAPTKA